MKITRVELDIAKQVFQVHGVDEHGKVRVRKQLARAKVLEFFAQLPPSLIGIEACASAHYWGRELTKLGHTVKLMAAQFVVPYRKCGKNDANDAEAICEAVGRPNMHFVAIKTEEQQSVLMVHRARTLVVANRTAQVNQIRGLLGEFGLVVPKGIARLRRELPSILEDADRGDWAADRHRAGGEHGRPSCLQERARLCRFDRHHSRAVLKRRQGPARSDHPPGRRVFAHPTGARCPSIPACGRQKGRRQGRVGTPTEGAPACERGSRCARRETCPYRLGDPCPWQRISTRRTGGDRGLT